MNRRGFIATLVKVSAAVALMPILPPSQPEVFRYEVTFNGQLVEFMQWDRMLQPSEITQLNNYVAQKFGIVLNG